MQPDKEPEAGWVFKPNSNGDSSQEASENSSSNENKKSSKSSSHSDKDTMVSWSASEYVSNPKNLAWFVGLGLATLVFAGLIYLFTKDYVSTFVIVSLGVIVGVFAARQPRTLDYRLDGGGIHMGPKFYPYGVFRSFSLAKDDAFNFISLSPLKRFMPPLSIHYAPDDEEKIVETLANYLPLEEHKRDIIDNFSRRVRF